MPALTRNVGKGFEALGLACEPSRVQESGARRRLPAHHVYPLRLLKK